VTDPTVALVLSGGRAWRRIKWASCPSCVQVSEPFSGNPDRVWDGGIIASGTGGGRAPQRNLSGPAGPALGLSAFAGFTEDPLSEPRLPLRHTNGVRVQLASGGGISTSFGNAIAAPGFYLRNHAAARRQLAIAPGGGSDGALGPDRPAVVVGLATTTTHPAPPSSCDRTRPAPLANARCRSRASKLDEPAAAAKARSVPDRASRPASVAGRAYSCRHDDGCDAQLTPPSADEDQGPAPLVKALRLSSAESGTAVGSEALAANQSESAVIRGFLTESRPSVDLSKWRREC
jgi:hypothetical protein